MSRRGREPLAQALHDAFVRRERRVVERVDGMKPGASIAISVDGSAFKSALPQSGRGQHMYLPRAPIDFIIHVPGAAATVA